MPSNLLLGTSSPVDTSREDLNFLPAIQYPASLNMDVQSMFPVAELSDLNNTDFSFLDDICTPGDNQHSGLYNMTDFNHSEGTLNEQSDLPVDWLSDFHNLYGKESTLPSAILDHVLSPGISDSSFNCPTVATESSCNTYEIQSLTNNSLLAEVQRSEDRLYSSSDETGEKLVVHNNVDAGKKYLKMRQKNNVASQRSRKLRKQKNLEMGERLKQLESENMHLTKLATELEKQRDALQKKLLLMISKKK